MYPSLKGLVEQDAREVRERLSEKHDIVCSDLVDTIDAADKAGQKFREEQVDLLILAYRTYIPDSYVHQLLSHLPGVPLLKAGAPHHAITARGDVRRELSQLAALLGMTTISL